MTDHLRELIRRWAPVVDAAWRYEQAPTVANLERLLEAVRKMAGRTGKADR